MKTVCEILRGHEKQSLLPSTKLHSNVRTLDRHLDLWVEHLPRQTLSRNISIKVCTPIPYDLNKPQDYWSKYLHFSDWKYLLVQPSLNTDIFLTLHFFFNLNFVTHEGTFLCPKVNSYMAHLVINWWATIPMDTPPYPWTAHLLPAYVPSHWPSQWNQISTLHTLESIDSYI